MKFPRFILDLKNILFDTVEEFFEDRLMKLSASLTYYALFSLSPILVILVAISSFIYNKDQFMGQIDYYMRQTLGAQASEQIHNFMVFSKLSGLSSWSLIIGIIILFFGASSLINDLQDSLNIVFRVRIKTDRSILKFALNKLIAMLTILASGGLLIVSIVLSTIISVSSEFINNYIPFLEGYSNDFIFMTNYLISIGIAYLSYVFIIKFLTAVRMRWKPVWVGGMFTLFLFLLGRIAITYYITKNDFSVFGAASSFVILIVSIYYFSIILFFGAKFTKIYAEFLNIPAIPSKNAQRTKKMVQNRDGSWSDLP